MLASEPAVARTPDIMMAVPMQRDLLTMADLPRIITVLVFLQAVIGGKIILLYLNCMIYYQNPSSAQKKYFFGSEHQKCSNYTILGLKCFI